MENKNKKLPLSPKHLEESRKNGNVSNTDNQAGLQPTASTSRGGGEEKAKVELDMQQLKKTADETNNEVGHAVKTGVIPTVGQCMNGKLDKLEQQVAHPVAGTSASAACSNVSLSSPVLAGSVPSSPSAAQRSLKINDLLRRFDKAHYMRREMRTCKRSLKLDPTFLQQEYIIEDLRRKLLLHSVKSRLSKEPSTTDEEEEEPAQRTMGPTATVMPPVKYIKPRGSVKIKAPMASEKDVKEKVEKDNSSHSVLENFSKKDQPKDDDDEDDVVDDSKRGQEDRKPTQ